MKPVFPNFFSIASFPVFVLDAKGVCIYCNDAWCIKVRRPREQVLGAPLAKAAPKTASEALLDACCSNLEESDSRVIEVQPEQNARQVYILFKLETPGQPPVFAVLNPVPALQRLVSPALEAWVHSEKVHGSPDSEVGVWALDMTNRRILGCSRFAELLSLPGPYVDAPMPYTPPLLDSQDRLLIVKAFRALRDGQVRSFSGEIRLSGAAGAKWRQLSAHAALQDAKYAPLLIAGAAWDVHAEKTSVISANKKSKTLDALMRYMPSPIVVTDKKFNLHFSNKAFRSQYPAPEHDEQFDIRNALPKELAPTYEKECAEVFDSGEIIRREHELDLHGDKGVYVVTRFPILDAGENIWAVGSNVVNVTSLRKAQARVEELETLLNERSSFMAFIGKSESMQSVYFLLKRMAQVDATVLITGESGVGKELAVESLHGLGPRASGPLVKVNCAALSESLLESELFGHVRGAFSGAIKNRVGRFEAADGGALFLDEIGDIPLGLQTKLLRFLENREFERVGESKPRKSDVRIFAATNLDLKKMVQEGAFRKDLYYRIMAMELRLPPLRERGADILLLCQYFLKKLAPKGAPPLTLHSDASRILLEYSWPGNVRELKNAMEFAQMICPDQVILPAHLPQAIQPPGTGLPEGVTISAAPPDILQRQKRPKELSPEEIAQALEASNGNKVDAARALGVSRASLYRRLKQLGW